MFPPYKCWKKNDAGHNGCSDRGTIPAAFAALHQSPHKKRKACQKKNRSHKIISAFGRAHINWSSNICERNGHQRDWNIQPEVPAPVGVLRYGAANHRTGCKKKHGNSCINSHCFATLARCETVHNKAGAGGLHNGRAKTLQDARRDKLKATACESTPCA